MFFLKKLRYLFRLIGALVKKQYLLLIVSAFLGAGFFILFPKLVKIIPSSKKTLKIGQVGQYLPSELPESVLNDLSFGLLSVSEKGEPIPNIAKTWTATEEGKIFILDVPEQKLFWHDGKEFSLSEVNYNFKDASMSAQKEKIIFELKEVFSPFLSILSKPLFKKGLIGLGKYKVKRLVKKGKYIEKVLLVDAKDNTLNNKLYRFYNNETDLKTGFNLGEVDYIGEIFDIEGTQMSPSVKIEKKLMENAYLALFFNTNKTPFSDKSFRQALAYAISKPQGKERATGPISPKSWAYNPDVKPYNLDLANSKSLLEKGGEDVSKLKLKLSTFPQHEQLANQIKVNLKTIGLEVEINISLFVPEDFDLLLIARKIPIDPDQYYFWHSTQAGNLSRYKSPRLDKLLEDGRKTMDLEERKTIYFDFQRFLVEETPAIFLSHPVYYEVVRN